MIKENKVHQSRTQKPLKPAGGKNREHVPLTKAVVPTLGGFRVSYWKHGMHTDK